MNLEQSILEAIRSLPPEQQREIPEHAKMLRKSPPRKRRKSGEGLWADFGVSLTAEDIDEARREMWKNFPREDI